MMSIPPVRFQVDIGAVKETLRSSFLQHQENYQQMILAEIEAALTAPNIQEAIRMQVSKLVDEAIQEIGKSYQIQRAVTASIEDSIIKTLKRK